MAINNMYRIGCLSLLMAAFLIAGVPLTYAKETTSAGSLQQMQRVNVNKASLEELQIVRGIGPVLAKRIIEYRASNGSFKTIEDVAQVKGIGKAKEDERTTNFIKTS
jgi:competence protein ComEA